MTAWTLNLRKPARTFRRSSASPSPSRSFRYQTSGVAATKTPPFQTATPVGQESLSARIVARSKTPSSSSS